MREILVVLLSGVIGYFTQPLLLELFKTGLKTTPLMLVAIVLGTIILGIFLGIKIVVEGIGHSLFDLFLIILGLSSGFLLKTVIIA